MIADAAKRRLGVRQRQQIVEVNVVVRGPCEVFGDQRGLVAFDEIAETDKMRLVEGLGASDRHADAVERHGMVAADGLERTMRRSAGAHIVLGMNFEESALFAFVQDRREMLVFEAAPGKTANPKG